MRKLILFSVMIFMASSCSLIYRSQAESTSVYSPAIETTTIATVDVSPKKITYRYIPEKKTAKSLSLNQLIQNAIYAAVHDSGNYDELVQVSYSIESKKVFFGKRVRSITVSGYLAKYVNFRETTESDVEKIEALGRAKMFRESDPKVIEIH